VGISTFQMGDGKGCIYNRLRWKLMIKLSYIHLLIHNLFLNILVEKKCNVTMKKIETGLLKMVNH
jgi:hypothetical protein